SSLSPRAARRRPSATSCAPRSRSGRAWSRPPAPRSTDRSKNSKKKEDDAPAFAGATSRLYLGGTPLRSPLFHELADLRAQFGRVLVAVHRNGMLHACLDQLLLRVGRDRDAAVHFARILAAVDIFAGHGASFGRV